MATYEILGVRMPAGTYLVGDPCYAVADDRWMEWLESANFRDDGQVLIAELDGHPVLGIGTAHGDGVYTDEDGKRYPVDAGLIGLVPIEVAGGALTLRSDLNHVVTFNGPFDCRYDDGVIRLGHIVIDTDPAEEACEDCGRTGCGGWCEDDDEESED